MRDVPPAPVLVPAGDLAGPSRRADSEASPAGSGSTMVPDVPAPVYGELGAGASVGEGSAVPRDQWSGDGRGPG